MHRIDGPGATVDNKFTQGDPSGGIAATQVTDDWLNALQEEIAGVIEAISGGALVKADNTQLLTALKGQRVHALTGYQKLASGLIIQWGTATTDVNGLATFTHPLAFPNNAFRVLCNYGLATRAQVFAHPGDASLTSSAGFASTSAGAALSGASLKFFVIGN